MVLYDPELHVSTPPTPPPPLQGWRHIYKYMFTILYPAAWTPVHGMLFYASDEVSGPL
jgi:hypothetical protein